MKHPLQCRCGLLKGEVEATAPPGRALCYCRDCQAFARCLGREGDVLDAQGGTEVVPLLHKAVRITEGREALACLKLRENGILRWYASCCSTPIGNTPPNYQISYVGLIHSCLDGPGSSLEQSFGPLRARVWTKSARGEPKPQAQGMAAMMLRIGWHLARARMDGSYKRSPFFSADGRPVELPRVLDAAELDEALNAD